MHESIYLPAVSVTVTCNIVLTCILWHRPHSAHKFLLRGSSSDATGGKHWVQIAARPDMALWRVGAVVHVQDGPLLPRQVRVYAGEN